MKRKPAVIAYDIQSNKRRRQVFRILKQWRLDAQYSVFECKLTISEAEDLFLQLMRLLDQKKDYLFLAWLDSSRESMGWTKCSKPGFKVPIWYAG